jgi:hypothetical protein
LEEKMKAVIRIENLMATPSQVDKGLKAIQKAYDTLMALPDKTRKTLKTRKQMLRLMMLQGYLEGLKRLE